MLVSLTSAVQHNLIQDLSPNEKKCIYTVIKYVPVISGVNLHSNIAISADMTWQDWDATKLHCSVKHVSAGTPTL